MPPRRYGLIFFGLSAILYGFDVYSWLQHPLIWWLRVVPDDIFYYLQVARNLASSGVSTFDGTTLTNGYHPGWMALLTLLSPVFNDKEEFFRGALALSFFLHFLNALALRWAIKPLAGELGSWLGATIWLLSPLPLTVAVQGMEGTLYELGLWLSVGYFLHFIAPRDEVPLRAALGFGATLALAFWGRTEGIVLTLVSVLWLLWREVARARTKGSKTSVLIPFCTFGSFLLLVSPWPLYCRFATGVWGQQSGAMKVLWSSVERHPDFLERLISTIIFFCFWWIGPLTQLFTGLDSRYFALGIPFFIALLIAMKQEKSIPTPRHENALWWQLLGWMGPFWLLTGCIYAFLFSDARTWYWASPGVFFLAVCWGGLAQIPALRKLSRPLAGALMLALMVVVNLRFSAHIPAPYQWQGEAYLANDWLKSRVPEGETLGVWNAGVPAYFGAYPVVNLDGLMNNEVVPYWKSKKFGAYLTKKKIRYLFDLPEAMVRVKPFCQQPLRVQAIATHKGSRRILWRVLP